MPARNVSIVSHTHWDREWYDAFQTFRLRLVKLMDNLLDLLETDPSYSHFLLDGQMAVVDDYLQVRPEARERIGKLASDSRIAVGPWYILMDEFLVSGETIVRNLQLGLEKAAEFATPMQVGYLPDMFGHIAQMPQILRLAELEHTVVWRGVPSAVDKTAFWWTSPDGSKVRAEYLLDGYGNGAAIPKDPEDLERRISGFIEEAGEALLDDVLFMNGTDHQEPQPWLGEVVAAANSSQNVFHFEIVSLEQYLAAAPTTGIPTWAGELRSGFRANMLMGVTSNRVDVKHAAAITERTIEKLAEPLGALFFPDHVWPDRLLEIAWTEIIRNSAHDSICACSADEVVDTVLNRFAEARQIADGVAAEAIAAFGQSLSEAGTVVLNPLPFQRSGAVELIFDGEEAPPGTQLLPDPPSQIGIPRGLGELTIDSGTAKSLLGRLPDSSRIDGHTWVTGVDVSEADGVIGVKISFGHQETVGLDIALTKRDLSARLAANPSSLVKVGWDQPPAVRVLAVVNDVPGYGWKPAEPSIAKHPVVASENETHLSINNDLLDVSVDRSDASYSINGIPGFGKLVDDGDFGDSYNYSPPSRNSTVSSPESVIVSLKEAGPIRAIVEVISVYKWPDHIDELTQARVGEQTVTVTTTLEVTADDPALRVTTTFVNPSRDHRLRVHLPLPSPAAVSKAECAFAVVERGLTAEGRSEEFGLPTFPSRRFVSAGGLTFAHLGLNEYELIDIEEGPEGEKASTIAITLLRSTGMLSRLGMTYRPMPAGPILPVDGLQLVGKQVTAQYAIVVGESDPYPFAEDFLVPLEVVQSLGGGDRPISGQALSVTGAQVSSLRRVGSSTEVRVFNPTAFPTTVKFAGGSGRVVSLRGTTRGTFTEELELTPFAVATVVLD